MAIDASADCEFLVGRAQNASISRDFHNKNLETLHSAASFPFKPTREGTCARRRMRPRVVFESSE